MRVLAALAALAAILLLGPIGSDAKQGLPDGWRRSQTRLVPKLLMPREFVSIANFGMAVGQGGDCGREPVAAIRRMEPGDALITLQEYRVTAGMRSHLNRNFPPPPLNLDFGSLRRSPLSGAGGTPVAGVTIPFGDGGRAFDALVYVAGRPTATLRSEIDAILRRRRH